MHGLVISIQVNVHILLNKLRVFQILWHSKAQTSKEKYISNLHTSLKTLKFIKRIDVLIIPGKKDKKTTRLQQNEDPFKNTYKKLILEKLVFQINTKMMTLSKIKTKYLQKAEKT